MLGQLIKTDWKAFDWIQLLQIRHPSGSGKTEMDIGITNGSKVWKQLDMRPLVTWFKEGSLDSRTYSMHVSATYREIWNTLVTTPSVTSQHLRVGLILPSGRILQSLSTHAFSALHDQSTRLQSQNSQFQVLRTRCFANDYQSSKGTCFLQIHEEFGSSAKVTRNKISENLKSQCLLQSVK